MKKIDKEDFLAVGILIILVSLFLWFLLGDNIWQWIVNSTIIFAIGGVLFSLKHLIYAKEVRKLVRRGTSLLLVIAISLSIPTFTSADDISMEEDEVKKASEINGNDLLQSIQQAICAYVEKYGLNEKMTDSELAQVYFRMNSEEAKKSWDELNELYKKAQLLDEESVDVLMSDSNVILGIRFYELIEQMNSTALTELPDPCNPVDGIEVLVVEDDEADDSFSNGVVTINVAGTDGCGSESDTDTITITNKSDGVAVISFDWKANDVNTLKIDDKLTSEINGTIKQSLSAGSCITFVITTSADTTNNQLVFSNFSLTPINEPFEVTVQYDSNLGSVAKDGIAISPGMQSVTKATFTATPSSNVLFLGWIDAGTNQILSKKNDYNCAPSENMKIKAVFAANSRDTNNKPWFMVNDNYLFDGLDLATSLTNVSSIVLMNNGTLMAGNYTIPSSATLLLPFDDEHTLYTDNPGSVNLNKSTPTPYKTLTMSTGANITVNGTISVSAKHEVGNGGGLGCCVSNQYGHISMNQGSSITVNNGGALYVWGYITGEGIVSAETGSLVYELFQVADYRGGGETMQMSKGTFPFNQFYIQNIEAEFVVKTNATVKVYASVYASWTQTTSFNFIGGSNSMFTLTSGTVTKKYDGTTDTLDIIVDGDLTVNPVSLKIATTSMNSSNFELPITNNMDIVVKSGTTTIGQDIALLPGATITINEDAEVVVGKGKNLYVYDVDQWDGYCGASNKRLIPVNYAPSKSYNRVIDTDAAICINGTLDASVGGFYTTCSTTTSTDAQGNEVTLYEGGGANIYSTGSGVVISSTGSKTSTTQHKQGDGDVSIAITNAKLKNIDESVVTSQTDTYTYTAGFWRCSNHLPNENCICTICGGEAHTFENYICTVCGKGAYIKQKGRNLNYDDMISIIDIFEVGGVGDTDLTKDAGLLIWTVDKFDENAISVDDEYAIQKVGLYPYPGKDYVYGESDGIYTRHLHEDAYYVGYVKLTNSDGSTRYIYSEPKLYSPSIYADNMLAKDSTDQETKDLCVALLNYISAAQMYFYPETTGEELVNAELSPEQKDIAPEWATVLDDTNQHLALAPAVTSPVERDTSIFTKVGKNLLFEEMISLGAVYKIEDSIVNNASEHGTIFWTPEQYDAVIANGQVPSLENAGNGEKIDLTQYREQSGQWVSNAPKIAPKDMSDTVYYFMGYVKHTDGSVSYSGVSAYTVEQYIYNKATAETTTQKEAYMAEFAKCLYFYERAAKAALLSE